MHDDDVAGGPFDGAGELERSVLAAVQAAGDAIDDRDVALVEQAKTYARQIDAVPMDAGQDRTKVLYLGPHLTGVLRELGLTPKGRAEIEKLLAQAKETASKAEADAKEKAPTPARPADELSTMRARRHGSGA